MNNSILKAHRGIDNEIIFRALGPDRVPFNIPGNQEIYARIIDPENDSVVIEKLCITGPAKGIIKLKLDSGDITDIHPGMYTLSLIRTEQFVVGSPDEYIEKPVFVDFDNNVAFQLEITDQAYKSPQPSVIITEKNWTGEILTLPNGGNRPSFYSSRIPGSRVLNHINSVHTFSTYTENFYGQLIVWGSLEESPDPSVNTNWFKIYPSTMSSDITYTGYSGTQAWDFQANFMWLKFQLLPSIDVLDPGKFVKLIVRT